MDRIVGDAEREVPPAVLHTAPIHYEFPSADEIRGPAHGVAKNMHEQRVHVSKYR